MGDGDTVYLGRILLRSGTLLLQRSGAHECGYNAYQSLSLHVQWLGRL